MIHNLDINDPELGYKTMIKVLEKNFNLCKRLNKIQNSNTLCFNDTKLEVIKNMLHIIDTSYLTCPIRSDDKLSQRLKCNVDAWGYDPILSGIK